MKTKKLIEWLQKHDPEGKYNVEVCMDEIQILSPIKGEPGTSTVIAQKTINK